MTNLPKNESSEGLCWVDQVDSPPFFAFFKPPVFGPYAFFGAWGGCWMLDIWQCFLDLGFILSSPPKTSSWIRFNQIRMAGDSVSQNRKLVYSSWDFIVAFLSCLLDALLFDVAFWDSSVCKSLLQRSQGCNKGTLSLSETCCLGQAIFGRNGDCQNRDLFRVCLQMTIPVTYGMNNRKSTHFADARDARGGQN